MSPGPPPNLACAELRRLLQEFVSTVNEHERILRVQSAAILNGDASFVFEESVAMAFAQKETAKEALLAHRSEHG